MEADQMNIIIDADACPRGAMDVVRRLQREYGFRLVTVASFHHDIEHRCEPSGARRFDADGGGRRSGPGDGRRSGDTPRPDTVHITVGDGPDEADWAVVNRVRPGDVVVTEDWGLAALVLAKGAACLSPGGHVYTDDRIDFRLDERHVKAKHRRAGGRTKGPRKRTDEDDRRFERALRRLLEGR